MVAMTRKKKKHWPESVRQSVAAGRAKRERHVSITLVKSSRGKICVPTILLLTS